MVMRQNDWLLDMIDQAAAAIVASITDKRDGTQADEDAQDPDHALDDLFPGLDAHAPSLAADSLFALLRTEARALVFGRLLARKALAQLAAGELAAGRTRLICAHDLLAAVARRPGKHQPAAAELVAALAPVRMRCDP